MSLFGGIVCSLHSHQFVFPKPIVAGVCRDFANSQTIFFDGIGFDMKKTLVAVAGTLLLGFVHIAASQNISDQVAAPNPAEVAARIQRQLETRYPLAKTTRDGGDIVAAGAVLVLQKDKLVMNKVYTSGTQRSSPIQNVYVNSEITQVGLMSVLSNINSFLSVLGGIEAQSRSFIRGERFWVTNITVQNDGIVFRLLRKRGQPPFLSWLWSCE